MAKKTVTDNWLDNAVEVPRAGVAANKDRSKRQRFYRRYIVAAVVLLPLALGADLLLLGSAAQKPVAAVQAPAVNIEGRAAAAVAVKKWLSSPRSPLPGRGSIVSWDGAKTIKKPAQTTDQKTQNPLPAYNLEVDSFTVIDGLGSTYTVVVQVAISATSGVLVLGTPSAIPIAATDPSAFAGATPWFGLNTAQAPEAVVTAINAWASAFTSGDPNVLRLAVQDTKGTNVYVPLSNVASKKLDIVSAAYLPDPGADPAKPTTTSTTMVVQVTLSVLWVGMPPLASGDNLPTITYDLLVHKVGTGAPIVDAWGGPGTGPTLKTHGNALSGAKSVPAPIATDAPTPSSSTPGSD